MYAETRWPLETALRVTYRNSLSELAVAEILIKRPWNAIPIWHLKQPNTLVLCANRSEVLRAKPQAAYMSAPRNTWDHVALRTWHAADFVRGQEEESVASCNNAEADIGSVTQTYGV